MRKCIYFSILAFVVGCSTSNKELYDITDSFVELSHKIYDVYGILDSVEHIKTTSNGQYQVMPVGRLIKVKILNVSNDDIYDELKEDLESHYKNDKRVNDVYYVNNAKIILIDCRN